MHRFGLAILSLALSQVATAGPMGVQMSGRPFGEPAAEPPVRCAIAGIRPGGPVPEAVLARAKALPRSVRILRLGDAATADFQADRLTII